MSMLPKAICGFNKTSTKIPVISFTTSEQIFQKLIWNQNDLRLPLKTWERTTGCITLSDIKLYYTATVITTV